MQDDESLERSVPVIEEELVTGARAMKTGSVRIHKEVERLLRTVEMPVVQDVASP
jgi:stress response protein YsnF